MREKARLESHPSAPFSCKSCSVQPAKFDWYAEMSVNPACKASKQLAGCSQQCEVEFFLESRNCPLLVFSMGTYPFHKFITNNVWVPVSKAILAKLDSS